MICVKCRNVSHILDPATGMCGQCIQAFDPEEDVLLDVETDASFDESLDALQRIIVTTETAHNLPVSDRLDILTAEVVIGMHLFKDIAAAFRDTFGGRSKVMQDGLRDARKTAMTELRREALDLGADAVVGVQLNYSEISGGGKSMLLLVASGTAVTLDPKRDPPS